MVLGERILPDISKLDLGWEEIQTLENQIKDRKLQLAESDADTEETARKLRLLVGGGMEFNEALQLAYLSESATMAGPGAVPGAEDFSRLLGRAFDLGIDVCQLINWATPVNWHGRVRSFYL